MKKIIIMLASLAIIISLNGCGEEPQSQFGPEWTPEQTQGFINRTSNEEMAYAGPFYFGNYDGINEESVSYSQMRNAKADEIIEVIDESIDILIALDTKLKQERDIFAWYIGQIQEIDESTMSWTDKLLRATNPSHLSEGLSNLILVQRKADDLPKSADWGFLQFQKFGGIVDLTDGYTYEAGSLMSRATALYYMLEVDQNTAYQDLNKEFISKLDPISEEINSLLNDLYRYNATVNYGQQLLVTGDYYFAEDSLEIIDSEIAKAKTSFEEYQGTNELLSEELLNLFKTKLAYLEDKRTVIATYLESIPKEELLFTFEEETASIIPTAYAKRNKTTWFNNPIKKAYDTAKFAKDMTFAAVRVAGQEAKKLYDKSGAHEALKDGAQILNVGLEYTNSTVEVTIYGIQGVYYQDMSWEDFKKKIKDENNEIHDRFVKGKLGKEQWDEVIRQVDNVQNSTKRFIDDTGELAGLTISIVTGSGKAGNFVTKVTKNVGNEAKALIDTTTNFTKNIAIVMHPETSKEDTRKALLDLYTALKATRGEDGKFVDVELPDIKEIVKSETFKELGLTKDEEKTLVEQYKEVFKEELKKEEEKQTRSANVRKILTNPELTDEEIVDQIMAEITRDLPPLKKKEKEKDTNDSDGDGIENEYDNCEKTSNSEQTDTDLDGIGDACDPDCSGDIDGDEVCNEHDNCPKVSNPDQIDNDDDGKGNECDFDAPTLAEIAGEWPGTMTVDDIIINEEFRAQGEAEGCDFSELDKQKGQKKPATFNIVPSGENAGVIKTVNEDGEEESIPFTYVDGKMKAGLSQEDMSYEINLDFSSGKAVGSLDVSAFEGNVEIDGTVELER